MEEEASFAPGSFKNSMMAKTRGYKRDFEQLKRDLVWLYINHGEISSVLGSIYTYLFIFPKDLDIKSEIKENDKTFEIIRHVLTETSVIFSCLMYKALS